MIVIKRDNSEELFQVEKIEKVIKKAFESCGAKMEYSVIDCVIWREVPDHWRTLHRWQLRIFS